MYARPILAPLDPSTTAASCCRIAASSGGQSVYIVNEPLCPFPLPTPSVCVSIFGSPLITDTFVCVLAT